MPRIVVYTAITNAYDNLFPPEVIDPGARYLAFVDRPHPPVLPWELQPAYAPFSSDVHNSRLPKLLPHLHFEADFSIYHDGSFRLRQAASEMVRQQLGERCDLALFDHPKRLTVGAEAAEMVKRCHDQPGVLQGLQRQLERWQAAGSPPGLWSGAVLVRRHCAAVENFNRAWWREFIAGRSHRDQLSLPIAVAQSGVRVHTMPEWVYENQLVTHHAHARFLNVACNAARQPLRAAYAARRAQLEQLCRQAALGVAPQAQEPLP